MIISAIVRYSLRATMLALILITVSVSGFSQPETHAQEVAPPPLKIIPRIEREQLNTAKDPKARVKTTLELADVHLATAETKTSEHEYDAAAAAAGMYWALLEDIFEFMKTMKQDSNKTRDLYKKIELTLRAHAPRLGIIRRSTPAAHAVWIKTIEEYARSRRTEALNSFYGHTVVRDGQTKQSETKPAEKPTP